jgi:uncharacterized UPF0160 family protein
MKPTFSLENFSDVSDVKKYLKKFLVEIPQNYEKVSKNQKDFYLKSLVNLQFFVLNEVLVNWKSFMMESEIENLVDPFFVNIYPLQSLISLADSLKENTKEIKNQIFSYIEEIVKKEEFIENLLNEMVIFSYNGDIVTKLLLNLPDKILIHSQSLPFFTQF